MLYFIPLLFIPLLVCVQGIPVIFALTRKRLGMVYGCYKLVSAVAVVDIRGAEDLHDRVVNIVKQT